MDGIGDLKCCDGTLSSNAAMAESFHRAQGTPAPEYKINKVENIRREFLRIKDWAQYVVDKTGCKMLEIRGACFEADKDAIFREVNWDYVQREIEWYESQSLNVHNIPGKVPDIWIKTASSKGEINSNYGWVLWSEDNGNQYSNVLVELRKSPDSRRAVAIYTRPTMWTDYNRDGMSDFMCTNAVQYFIRDGKLEVVVQMRSNDVVFGYLNDRAWQYHVQTKLAQDLGVPLGRIIWQVGSLHVYERHFGLIV